MSCLLCSSVWALPLSSFFLSPFSFHSIHCSFFLSDPVLSTLLAPSFLFALAFDSSPSIPFIHFLPILTLLKCTCISSVFHFQLLTLWSMLTVQQLRRWYVTIQSAPVPINVWHSVVLHFFLEPGQECFGAPVRNKITFYYPRFC